MREQMKCPYILHRNTVIDSYMKENDDGVQTGAHTEEKNYAVMMDCIKERCAVWINGECHYKC